MKNKRFYIICMVCLLVFNLLIPISSSVVEAKQKGSRVQWSIEKYIPTVGKQYVRKNYKSMLKDALNEKIYSDITIEDISLFHLEVPYIIYNFNEVQDPVYYFPLSYKNKVLFVLELLWDGEQYSLGIGTDMVETLNSIKYIKNPSIFYEYRGEIVAENEIKKYCTDISFPFGGNADEEEERIFYEKSFYEKIRIIGRKIKKFTPADKIKWNSDEELFNSLLGLTLYKPQGQYGYNMCWASAAATIINYWNDSVVTGFDVCNKMGIGYDKGGNVYDVDDALRKYGVRYNHIKADMLEWKKLKNNIDIEAPILLSAHATSNGKIYGHAATIYGYRTSDGVKKVKIWNSVLNEGKGGYKEFNYNASSCFSISGLAYTWDGTLYYC